MGDLGLYKRILDNTNVVILVFDGDQRLTYVNPAGEVLCATSAKNMVGSRVGDIFGSDQRFSDLLGFAASEGHPFTDRELELRLPGHHVVTVDVTVTPLAEPGGTTVLLVEMYPLDRLRRMAREEQLIAQHSIANEVVRGLAHEINNPLGGLRGAAQLLEKALPDPSLKEYTQVIVSEADRLRNLLSRMSGPKTPPQKQPQNLHEVLERVRALVSAEKPPGVTISRDYDPSLPDINMDLELMIQAVLNVVRNAVQAVGKFGHIVLRTRAYRNFTIGSRRHRLVAMLEVIDDGPGVPEAIAEKIFYPMVTGRPDGTGLGLSIAQTLVKQHNGVIECNSRPGHTVFTIYLPLDNTHD